MEDFAAQTPLLVSSIGTFFITGNVWVEGCQRDLTGKSTETTVSGESLGNEVNIYNINVKHRDPNHVKIQVNLVIRMSLLTYIMDDTLNSKEVDIDDNNS